MQYPTTIIELFSCLFDVDQSRYLIVSWMKVGCVAKPTIKKVETKLGFRSGEGVKWFFCCIVATFIAVVTVGAALATYFEYVINTTTQQPSKQQPS